MKNKILIPIVMFVASGCTSQYDFYPHQTLNNKIDVVESSKEESSISIQGYQSFVEITSLEDYIGPWVAPKMKITIKNESEDKIMEIRGKDINISFNDFWFPIEKYTIVKNEEDSTLDFTSEDNFGIVHEVLPKSEINIIATFKTPKSVEYYEKDSVLIEIFSNLDIYNIQYKIKKKL